MNSNRSYERHGDLADSMNGVEGHPGWLWDIGIVNRAEHTLTKTMYSRETGERISFTFDPIEETEAQIVKRIFVQRAADRWRDAQYEDE